MQHGDLDVLVNQAEFITFMQSCVPLGPGKFHVVVLVSMEKRFQKLVPSMVFLGVNWLYAGMSVHTRVRASDYC